MIRRRSLRTRAIKMLVLDEADEMLNKGEIFISLVLLFAHLFEILISSQLVALLLKTAV